MALGNWTLICLLSPWPLWVSPCREWLAWAQHSTYCLSILLISITDICVALILRLWVNAAVLFGIQVLSTSVFPTGAHGSFRFLYPQVTGVCEPLRAGPSTHSQAPPSATETVVHLPLRPPLWMLCCSNTDLLWMVCDGPSLCPGKQRINKASLDAPSPMWVLLLWTDYSLSLRFDLWAERREADLSQLILCPSLISSSTEMFFLKKKSQCSQNRLWVISSFFSTQGYILTNLSHSGLAFTCKLFSSGKFW